MSSVSIASGAYMAKISFRSAFFQTYIVWGLFSFLNLGLFFPILVLPLLPLLFVFCIKFFAFLFPVIFLSIIISIPVCSYIYIKLNIGERKYMPAIVNVVLIIVFLLVADIVKYALIEIEINRVLPQCVSINSFARSVINQGEFSPEHAYYVKNNQIFFWSYSELKFVEGYESALKQYQSSIRYPCSH
jgi:hypothetical protein